MTALALERAPAPVLPLVFLLTAPLWGIVAGALLVAQGESTLTTRWSPTTVALVHAITLGVLGNAMLGSLLQFLPVVMGVRIVGARFSPWLHGLFNGGIVLLLTSLISNLPRLLPAAAILLTLALAGFALAALAGFRPARHLRLLYAGTGMALVFLLITAALGAALAGALAGHFMFAFDRYTDIHAAIGVLGWILLLTASVGSITMPMFQGTAAYSPRAFVSWLLSVVLVLAAGSWLRARGAPTVALGILVSIPILALALALLRLQIRARPRRNPVLRRFWSVGLLALAVAALLVIVAPGLAFDRMDMLAGVLVLGIGLPFLVLGMLLEIVAFLSWIRLHLGCKRGIHLPGVHTLLTDADKSHVFLLQGLAVSLLLLAVLSLQPWLAWMAGAGLMLAHGVLFLILLGAWQRAGHFLSQSRGQS